MAVTGGLAPNQRPMIAKLGLKALLAGSLSNLMSAALAGPDPRRHRPRRPAPAAPAAGGSAGVAPAANHCPNPHRAVKAPPRRPER